ncbi:MAG: hypothetical protein AMJ79_09240 [Phycisphaerae bacterium SM23_30]|nr:MAG: hypothetical protein AMJ79_09240 [Phycisphaerae bacterium SM23_30]
MLRLIITAVAILLIAVFMTMAGRGGGNFYVILLIIAGESMHQAATTGQFIMFVTAIGAILIFHKHKIIAWPMAVMIGLTTGMMAFVGGMAAYEFTGITLKYVFAAMLTMAGLLMLLPVKPKTINTKKRFGYWSFKTGDIQYTVNFYVALPVMLATGLAAGMVGVSGGSFLVPLMVLACGLPVRVAVGTASTMVAMTALMGFLGHAVRGEFDPVFALPLGAVAIMGGIIGGKFALKTEPVVLKRIFAFTTLAAAGFMIANALLFTM